MPIAWTTLGLRTACDSERSGSSLPIRTIGVGRARNRMPWITDREVWPMRIAWFSHRYYPCVGGAENYSRAMVRRFVAAGYEVDVFTSDAHDLWYFNDRTRRRLEGPMESRV